MKQNFLLGLIILLGLGLRLINLANLPAILNRDGAALAYNAYLLKTTGHDEWGQPWPLMLESFGDFKLAGYPVILVGLFSILPMNDALVRLPSVLAGTVLIWLAYLWGKKIYQNRNLALLAALLIALSPVFFFYSRIAFEANVALTLTVAALYCWLLVKPSLKLDLGGLILISFAVITYNTPWLLLPLMILVIIFCRGVIRWRAWFTPVAGAVAVFLIFSLIFIPLTGQKKGITIFTDETTWNNYLEYRANLSPVLQKFLGNRWVYNGQLMWQNLSASFSYPFLVSRGGTHPWHALPDRGHLFLTSYGLGWLGLAVALIMFWRMVKNRRWNFNFSQPASLDLCLTFLLFGSLLPSIITVDSRHATRSLLFFFFLVLLGLRNLELGVKLLVGRQQRPFKLLPIISQGLVLIFVLVESASYLQRYFFYYPTHQPSSLKIGLKETVQTVESKYPDDQVAYVDGQGYDYILVAWYGRIAAADFFRSINKQLPDRIGFRYGDHLTHYHFIADQKDRSDQEKVLVDWDGKNWSIYDFSGAGYL